MQLIDLSLTLSFTNVGIGRFLVPPNKSLLRTKNLSIPSQHYQPPDGFEMMIS